MNTKEGLEIAENNYKRIVDGIKNKSLKKGPAETERNS